MPNNDEVENEDNIEKIKDPMQKLEEALIICKFGWFNIKLMCTTIIAVFASTMVTTSTSYILSSAECDLNMSFMQKGLLNASPFVGQIGAGLFTGFITDAFGRKLFLVGGHAGVFICSILEGSSQTYWMLMLGKLIEGIFLSLCFTATATMVPEFTHINVRDRATLLYSSFMPISIIMAALMSWAFLPQTWHFVILEGYFELHAWNLYLYACSIWSLLAGVLYYHLPESPKFLLSQGREKEALEVLQQMYHENTGNPKQTFPITSLSIPGTFEHTDKRSMKKQLTNALFEVKELFRKPLFCNLLLFAVISFVCLLAYSGLRLWYPQVSTIVENYQKEHGTTEEFCVMINDYTSKLKPNISSDDSTNSTAICVPQLSGSETYINGIIMGLASLTFICVSGYFVDIFGQKPLIFVLFLLCALCSGVLYWTNSSLQIAFLISATCAFMQTALSLQYSITVRVFPTTLRALTMSIVLMIGRIGSLVGTILFPVTLEAGCMGPFIVLSAITICVAGVVYFLPNPRKDNKEIGDR